METYVHVTHGWGDDSGFRAQGSGFRVQDLGLRV
jgi:hypothetical protein